MFAKPCDRPCQRKPSGERKTQADLDHAIRQLVSKTITAEDEIIDVFTAAGIKRPDISILDEKFLAEVRGLKHKHVAAELVTSVRQSVTIDWTVRESARAKIRVMVRRILKKHGYPPDLQDEATKLVSEQAEALCSDWAA